jgi:hypothetical protein
MPTVQAATYNGRQLQDANLTVTTALPAQAASVTATSIDLGDNSDGIFPEGVALEIVCPATPSLASGGTITYTVLADSVAVPTTVLTPSLTYVTTGTAGNGAALTAGVAKWKVPANVARYLSVQATAGTTAGNNTAISFTYRLLGAGTDSN